MLNSFLKMISGGTKSDRDIKEIMPLVEKAKVEFEKLQSLDNDGLRAMTLAFRQKIADAVQGERDEIDTIKARIDSDFDIDIEEKEELYKRIDFLDKEEYRKTQETLMDILPAAFAVVKETGRRFSQNETLEVTATQFDRDQAARKDSVNIVEDKAYWDNRWMAGGNMVTWDMVHYDVQLIGGGLCFTQVKFPKWEPVKVKHSLLHCQFTSMLCQAKACMW
jgi:preprotein translocase subunit SecA